MLSALIVIIFFSGTIAEDEHLVDGIVASQSTTSDDNVASRAIDGNFDTDLSRGHCSLTESESFNWWMLDLTTTFSISTVRIYNRADCCRMDLKDAVVDIASDSSFETYTQCDTPYSEDEIYASPMIDKSCSGVSARYVRISSSVSPIQLCEVQVFGSELDVCSLGNDCDVTNGLCVNNGTSYYCECNSNYYLLSDGRSCLADACSNPSLNECDPAVGVCSNNRTHYYCECQPNYLLQDDGHTCIVDPCSNSSLNNCDQQHGNCTTRGTSYDCGCDVNYFLQDDGYTCVADPCSNSTLNNCDRNYGLCISNGTEYKCACQESYILHPDEVTCSADPCSNSTLNNCDGNYGLCISNGTEYKCACQESYILQPDGFTCSDIDVCANSTLNDCDEVRGFCVNNGTGYYCGCDPPYQLKSDGIQCIAIPQSKSFELVSSSNDACLKGQLRQFNSRSLLRCANACLGVTSCTGYHFDSDAGGTCTFQTGRSDVEETCYATGNTYVIPSP